MVNRPCWKEQITYLCESDPLEGCKHLKDKNCTLASSECVDKHGELCLKWRHQYICKLQQEVMSTGVEGGEVFCLDGNCYTPQNDQNTDMNNAVAHLAIFSQMQKDLVADPPRVFTGECLGCSKHMASFINCCSSMKGWGRSAGFSACKPEEEKLARQRAAGLCHLVGTYCAEKFPLGGCMRKKSTFCCFQSKLARIFHEGGRGQIGMSWGTPENPECRAFTVEELQRIDFSQINLTEIFADLFRDIGSKIQKMVPRQMQDQMPVLQKDIDLLKARNQQNWNQDGVQKTVF